MQLIYIDGAFYYIVEGKPAPWSPQGKSQRSW